MAISSVVYTVGMTKVFEPFLLYNHSQLPQIQLKHLQSLGEDTAK